MKEETSALDRVLRKEFEQLLDDPEQLEKFMDLLYQIAKKKVVEEHNLDLIAVTGLLFRYTEKEPASDAHQFVLRIFDKYGIPNPSEFAKHMHPPGNA